MSVTRIACAVLEGCAALAFLTGCVIVGFEAGVYAAKLLLWLLLSGIL